MKDNIEILKDRVILLQNATKIEKISKGYSPDKKYVVATDNKKYLLRVGDIEGYERKKTEFQILNCMQGYNVKSPIPIDIGVMNDLGICFNIFSYIEGEDAKNVLPLLTDQEQYRIGIECGKDLRRMHQHPAPIAINSWYERAMIKHYKYLESYKSCGLQIKNDDKIIDFIEHNTHYLKRRPNKFQHDDFHIENIIVCDKEYVGVIDFNNYDWGDPLHDFVKVALFNSEVSIPYSIGQINGYYDKKVEREFWILYSIYVAMTLISSVVWSIKVAPMQLDKMIESIYRVMEDHKNFELLKPTWFQLE